MLFEREQELPGDFEELTNAMATDDLHSYPNGPTPDRVRKLHGNELRMDRLVMVDRHAARGDVAGHGYERGPSGMKALAQGHDMDSGPNRVAWCHAAFWNREGLILQQSVDEFDNLLFWQNQFVRRIPTQPGGLLIVRNHCHSPVGIQA